MASPPAETVSASHGYFHQEPAGQGSPKFARFARPAHPAAGFSLRSKEHPTATLQMPSRRIIRKTTLWTPEEWRHIEEAAQRCGVPPARYVREGALAAKLTARTRRRGAHALFDQLKRVHNNLCQLRRIAEEDGADAALLMLDATIRMTDEAADAAGARRGSAHPLIIAVRDAGRLLNELTHQAHVAERLPADEELGEALARIQVVVIDVLG
jgi:mobilization protein NikA